jgi:hypothetical protein
MPGVDYVPNGEAQYETWLAGFVAYCVANEKELGLTPEVIAGITALRDSYSEAFKESFALKQALKGATKQKVTARKEATDAVRSLANQFKANPAISQYSLGELGLLTSKESHPVRSVTGLNFRGFDNGTNQLKWNRNGNSSDTVFLVEYSLDFGTTWFLAGAVSRVKFNHEGQVPGRTVYYRVFANRSGVTSAPTKSVAAYLQSAGPPVANAA